MRLTVHTEQALGLLRRLIARFLDTTPLMAEVSEEVLAMNLDRFQAAVDPDGLPWAPLRPATVEEKARLGFVPNILQRRGFLIGGIRPEFANGYAAIVSDTEYSEFHQLGTRDIPARPFLGLGADEELQIAGIIESYFREVIF